MRPIEESGRFVALTDNYAPEMEMITSRLPKFPNSTDPDVVGIKVGRLDITGELAESGITVDFIKSLLVK